MGIDGGPLYNPGNREVISNVPLVVGGVSLGPDAGVVLGSPVVCYQHPWRASAFACAVDKSEEENIENERDP